MKLLYVGMGHPLQEADDCLMWHKLGLDWFSTGYYSQSKQPGDLPYINHTNDPGLTKLWNNCTGHIAIYDTPGGIIGVKNKTFTSYNQPNLWQFTVEFMSQFDIILFNHYTENLRINWGNIHKLLFHSSPHVGMSEGQYSHIYDRQYRLSLPSSQVYPSYT